MEFWLIVIGVGIVIYFINQNKTTKSDKTIIRHQQIIKTENGEIRIEQTQTIDSLQTDYGKSNPAPVIKTIPKEPQRVINEQSIKRIEQQLLEPLAQAKIAESESATIEIDGIHEEELTTSSDKKKCPRCCRNLTFDKFKNSSKYSDGLTKWCAECLSAPRDSTYKKYCPKCKKNRLKTSFYKNSKRWDGFTLWCKTCMDKSK